MSTGPTQLFVFTQYYKRITDEKGWELSETCSTHGSRNLISVTYN
jgi:hypothetical protein